MVETLNNLGANARACPRTSCEIIVTLRPGFEIQALGRVEGDEVYGSADWIHFEYNGESAYIHSELVGVAPLSQPTQPSANLDRFSSSSRWYSRNRLNARAGPGINYPVMDFVPADAALEIVGKSGDWYLVKLGNREVYIAVWLTYEETSPKQENTRTSEVPNAVSNTVSNVVPNAPGGQNAVAIQVIDGDTIDVRLGNETVRVRYIGVDTPERGEPCYAEATNYNRSLVQGKALTLERDTSDYGPYSRLLRYVYANGVFVNLALVQAGYAQASYYAPNGKYRHVFEAAQRSAPNRGCSSVQNQSLQLHQVQIQSVQPQQVQPDGDPDNCCFLGWQCESEDEWKKGYFAFQNNQCDGPSPSAQTNESRPQQSSPRQSSCDCSKTCGQMSSCEQAKYYFRDCGCDRLDGDNDGIPCESVCR